MLRLMTAPGTGTGTVREGGTGTGDPPARRGSPTTGRERGRHCGEREGGRRASRYDDGRLSGCSGCSGAAMRQVRVADHGPNAGAIRVSGRGVTLYDV